MTFITNRTHLQIFEVGAVDVIIQEVVVELKHSQLGILDNEEPELDREIEFNALFCRLDLVVLIRLVQIGGLSEVSLLISKHAAFSPSTYLMFRFLVLSMISEP